MVTRSKHSQMKERKHTRAESAILNLTPKQQKAVIGITDKGMTQLAALEYAGYASPLGSQSVFSNPPVKAAIQERFKHAEAHWKMDREKVLDGFMEAVNMAKVQADPEVMIQGWREIGRLCGYYAPEVKKIQLDVSHKRLMNQFETLSDEELLKIASDNAKVIEAEVLEVKEELKNANSDDLLSNVIDHIGK